jgi:deoxyribodipyrimidine photo-lyase
MAVGTVEDLILFWHRRDLRLADNVSLGAARQRSCRVVGVFCLDPAILQRDDVAAVRVAYLLDSLRELQEAYAQAGSQLWLVQGNPAVQLGALAQAVGAAAIAWNLDVEPYAQVRDRAVTEALHAVGTTTLTDWDLLLHSPAGDRPDTIRAGSGSPYTVYTPFWKNWIKHPKAAPLPPIQGLLGLTPSQQDAATAAGATLAIPTAQDLGHAWTGEWVLPPGAAAAQRQLAAFCDRAIFAYHEQRNIPSTPGTSLLSAALKFGTIGIRTVWAQTVALEPHCASAEAETSVQTWRQELAWREFYAHALYHFPELADGPYRATFQQFPWDNSVDHFAAWCAGATGYPIVDAAMRQLNQTGWMHNRCRMIVASFLTKDLIIDWRWGEKYFMQQLIDGDLAANNGGWQWSASSGMDPKPLRIFNPASQAQKFDPEADYIRTWLPELQGVGTQALVMGTLSPQQCQRAGYPQPMVDHSVQQRRFKALYQQVKGA